MNPPPVPPRRYLTVPEVAYYLSVGKSTVYRLVETGELDAVHIGRLIRIPEPALRAFIQAAKA